MNEIRTLAIVGFDQKKSDKTNTLVSKIFNKKVAVYAEKTVDGVHQIIASNQGTDVQVALWENGPLDGEENYEPNELYSWNLDFVSFSKFYWDRDDRGDACGKQFAVLQETPEGWKVVYDTDKSLFAGYKIATNLKYWHEKAQRSYMANGDEWAAYFDSRKLTSQVA